MNTKTYVFCTTGQTTFFLVLSYNLSLKKDQNSSEEILKANKCHLKNKMLRNVCLFLTLCQLNALAVLKI